MPSAQQILQRHLEALRGERKLSGAQSRVLVHLRHHFHDCGSVAQETRQCFRRM